jgi:hypothetical protein
MSGWDVFPKSATAVLGIPDRPRIALHGDALWLSAPDSTGGFLVLGDNKVVWDARGR